MLTYAIVLLVGLAGYAGYTWWVVPPAAACLTLQDWWPRLWHTRNPGVALSTKKTTYVVTGIVLDISLAGLIFGLGRIARMLLGWF